MTLSTEKKQEIFEKFGNSKTNTGSTEGQVALFTQRINHLTGHLKQNQKDFATEKALVTLVGKRRKLLDYLKNKDILKYRELINLGFNDIYRYFNKSKQEYTFWDYFAGSWQKNYGMRIDHFLVSDNLLENIKTININQKPRGKEKPSDHTPIELEII